MTQDDHFILLGLLWGAPGTVCYLNRTSAKQDRTENSYSKAFMTCGAVPICLFMASSTVQLALFVASSLFHRVAPCPSLYRVFTHNTSTIPGHPELPDEFQLLPP